MALPADKDPQIYSGFLKGISLFRDLTDAQRAALASRFELQSASEGTVLFEQGDPGDALFVVLEGEVEIYVVDHTGDKVSLLTAGKNDLFGELSVLDLGPRTATARAVVDSDLLMLRRKALFSFLRENPDAAVLLMQVMANRVRRSNEIIQHRIARSFNQEIEQKLSLMQKSAAKAAEFSGSFMFLWLNAILFAGWVIFNLGVVPGVPVFDPYPFGALAFFVSIEAIFLSIIVLIAQNLQAATDKIRNDIEYEVNLRAENEVTHLHGKVDSIRSEMLSRLHRIEKAVVGLNEKNLKV